MKRPRRLILPLIAVALLAGVVFSLRNHTFAVLEPAGTIAEQQRQLIYIVLALSLIIVVPVFGMLTAIVWRYRETNKKARYDPELDGNKWAEISWWFIPSALIAVLAVMTWTSTHKLDPYRPLSSPVNAINVQVVALDWKWLFIYPDENIATVNYLNVPIDTPINFKITADAPMNSFWIPQLGGQVYAMPGMTTQLHLAASKIGEYRGSSANLSGKGFSDMNFVTSAVQPSDYKAWVESVKSSNDQLDQPTYDWLSKPSVKDPVVLYASTKRNLYDTILIKYMEPTTPDHEGHDMSEMGM